MSMNFIEPEAGEMVSIGAVLETLPIKSEDKEWLQSLILENEIEIEMASRFKDIFLIHFAKESEKTGSNSFKVLFLFSWISTTFQDFFDENKLSRERINILPELFIQKQDNKPVLFKPHTADILRDIQSIEEIDSAFSKAYGKKKQEVREASSLAERIYYYMNYMNPYNKEVQEYLFGTIGNKRYSMDLISELDEIPKLFGELSDFDDFRSAYYLACWILKHDKNNDTSNVFKPVPLRRDTNEINQYDYIFEAAYFRLIREKIILPDIIFHPIDRFYGRIGWFGKGKTIIKVDLFLYHVFAAIDGNDTFQRILECISNFDELSSLYLVRYRYTHDKFVKQEFIDFLFSFNKLAGVELLLILRAGCPNGKLIEQVISTIIYELAIHETEPSCIELCGLLEHYSNPYENIAAFMDSEERIEALKARCGEMLRNFRFIGQEELSENERDLRYTCAKLAADFLLKKTGKEAEKF